MSQGFLNPLSRLCGRFSRLSQANVHAKVQIRSRTKETDALPLAWDPHAKVANLCRQLLVLELSKPRTRIGQGALDIMVLQERLSAAAD